MGVPGRVLWEPVPGISSIMASSLTPQQQADTSQVAVRYIAALRKISAAITKIADVLESMLNVEGASSMELSGFITTSANSILRNVSARIMRAVPWHKVNDP